MPTHSLPNPPRGAARKTQVSAWVFAVVLIAWLAGSLPVWVCRVWSAGSQHPAALLLASGLVALGAAWLVGNRLQKRLGPPAEQGGVLHAVPQEVAERGQPVFESLQVVFRQEDGLDAEGAAMLPIRPKSRLLGFVEIGKAQRFSFRELAIAEELVAMFVTKSEQSGWS